MKFFRRSLSLALGVGIFANAAEPSPAPENLEKLSLAEIEHLEFEHPQDALVKFELGRRYWCENQRGPALEQWLWLKQFKPQSPLTNRAHKLTMLARKNPNSVATKLSCEKLVKASKTHLSR